jgi:hypothetical protein
LFLNQIRFVDPRWNRFADSVSFDRKTARGIYHFVGPSKPWNKYLNTIDFILWRSFYARYVRCSLTLFTDRAFLRSYLQFLRYRVISGSKLLRRSTQFLLGLKTANNRHRLEAFLERYRLASMEGRTVVSGSDLRGFLHEIWGAAP